MLAGYDDDAEMVGESDLVAVPDDVGSVAGNASVDDSILVSIGETVTEAAHFTCLRKEGWKEVKDSAGNASCKPNCCAFPALWCCVLLIAFASHACPANVTSPLYFFCFFLRSGVLVVFTELIFSLYHCIICWS